MNTEVMCLPEVGRGVDQKVRGKKHLSVQALLDWAFRRECATLDFYEDHAPAQGAAMGFGLEYILIQQARLGCRVDGGGRSLPHHDADIVAAAVSSLPNRLGGRGMAIQVAELAKAGRCPNWMPGAITRVEPASWKVNRHGKHGQSELLEVINYMWRGRMVRREVRYCPIIYTPSPAQIAGSRRNYLLWWNALFELRNTFKTYNNLMDYEVGDELPAKTPWKSS